MTIEAGYDPIDMTTLAKWKNKRVRVDPFRPSPAPVPRRRRGFLRMAPWARQRKLTVTITYRGGGECWYLVEARGTSQVFPGWLAVEDMMARVYSER